MNFDGFKDMFGDFQQLISTFQEISRESVDGSFSSKIRNAKVSLQYDVCVTTAVCYYRMCYYRRVFFLYVLLPSCVAIPLYSPRCQTQCGVDTQCLSTHALTHVYMQMSTWDGEHELTSLLIGDTGVSTQTRRRRRGGFNDCL